jgi:hypothetical protein
MRCKFGVETNGGFIVSLVSMQREEETGFGTKCGINTQDMLRYASNSRF